MFSSLILGVTNEGDSVMVNLNMDQRETYLDLSHDDPRLVALMAAIEELKK